MNENESLTDQNVWDIAEAMLRVKLTVLSLHYMVV